MHTEKQARQSLMSPMVQLLKCCDHPYLFPGIEKEPFEEGEHLVNDSGKALILDRLLAYLHKKGHRVLIFTQMQRFLDIVYDIVQLRGYTCVQLDGTVKASERQEAIEKFQEADSDIFVFLLTTKAGGLGLNLTGADTVIFLDWDFNPQNDRQAAARCHRIGQDKPVKIIRLVAKHTIEELIKHRAGKKLKLSELVLGTDENDGQSSKVDLSKLLFEGLSNLEKAQKKDVQLHVLTDKQLEEKLGRTKRGGRWEVRDDNKENIDDDQQQLLADGDSTDEAEEMSLYMFEGHDYRQTRAAVKKADDGLGNNAANSRADDNDKKQQLQQ
uniref:Helicase C-terminal domain-containing protein n=1 Tax=Globodera pallida TaxID=36090 RepID=A0A183BN26_GLOPA